MDTSGYRMPATGTVPTLADRMARLRGLLGAAGALWRAHGIAATRYVTLGAFMVIMLFLGFTQQVRPPATVRGTWGDVYRYQCFAVAFWSGEHGLSTLQRTQCQAVVNTLIYNQQTVHTSHYLPPALQRWMLDHSPVVARFRTLPLEYPILSLIPFSLPLLAPLRAYPLAFGLEMLILAVVMYAWLARLAGWRAAAVFALFMAFGAYATGASRFDLVPAALTLGALVLAERRRWTWAYVLLALATMTKFYPVLLVAPLVVAQLGTMPSGERRWQRLTGLFWFVGICAVLGLVSFAINPIGAYRQLSVLGRRPVEVESVTASLLWLASWLHVPMQSFISFGSDNVTSALEKVLTALVMLLFAAGLGVVLVRQWRGRLRLSEAWLAVLLLTVVSGKIFSAQYLIWIFPFVAYTLVLSGILPMLWMAVCALTTYSYPFLWRAEGSWHATIALRNALVLFLTAMALRLWIRPGGDRTIPAAPAVQGAQLAVRQRDGPEPVLSVPLTGSVAPAAPDLDTQPVPNGTPQPGVPTSF